MNLSKLTKAIRTETQADRLFKTWERRYEEGKTYAYKRVCEAGPDTAQVNKIIQDMELSIALSDLGGQTTNAFDEGVLAYIRSYRHVELR